MLISAGAGGATAAAPTVNNSGSNDTAFTSEATDGATLGENNTFEGNDSAATVHSFITDDNESVKQYIEAKGTQIYANTSADEVNYNSTSGESTFNVSVNHGQLADMEHAIGENVSTTWYMVNNTTADDSGESNITVYVEWDNSTTVQNIDDSDVEAEDVVTVTDSAWSVAGYNLTAGPLGTTTADVETEDRKVNGSQTDVVIALSNSSAQEMFDESTSEASSGDKLSKLWSGTRTVATVSDADGKTVAVPVYYESTPDDVEESSTYAVYKKVGGTWALSVNLGDSFEDAEEVSVNAIGSAGSTSMLWSYLSASGGSMTINTGAMLGMVPIVAGRRQRGAVVA